MSLAATSLLLISLSAAPAPQKVTLIFGGDVIPHEPVKKVAEKHARFAKDGTPLNDSGWGHVFGPLSPVFRAYDFAIVNLETPVTREEQKEVKEMLFNAPPALLAGLKSSGVDVATTIRPIVKNPESAPCTGPTVVLPAARAGRGATCGRVA